MTEKICTKCKRSLPLARFYPRKGGRFGVDSICKTCAVDKVRKWRLTPGAKEKTRAAALRYSKTVRGRTVRWAYGQLKWRKQAVSAYHKSEAGKRSQRKTNQSPAAKENAARYFATEKGKAALRRKQRTEAGKASAARANHKRRMLTAGPPTLTAAEWTAIQVAQAGLCAYCGEPKKLTMDHVVPLSRGGSHTKGNVVGACKPCNSRKKAKLLEEWRPSSSST